MKYIVIPNWNLVIGAPPKCGSTSIYAALHEEFKCTDKKCRDMLSHVPLRQVPIHVPVMFVVRHPLDRFKSHWRHRCVPGGDKEWGTGRACHGMTPKEFWIQRDRADDHWQTQTHLLGSLQEYATLVRLESLNRYWMLHTPSKVALPEHNATYGHVPGLTYRLERTILKFYSEDLYLYEVAK